MLGSTSGRILTEGETRKGRYKVFGRGVVASALAGTPLRRRAERRVVAHGEKRG
jgi:hypothetical protein